MDKDEILFIINSELIDISKIKLLLSGLNIIDIAEILQELDKEKITRIFRVLPKNIASDVFAYMDSDYQQIIIEALTDTEIGEIMSKLFMDDTVDFIEEMPANVVNRVLENLPAEKRKLINQILQYPEDSAGSIMTTEYVHLSENTEVHDAFEIIRKTGLNKETIYTCYVTCDDRLLLGVVSAKDLLLARPAERIGEIMDTAPIFAYTTDDREVTAEQFHKYGLLAMPVVDKEKRLVGIITVDDIVNVIVEENTEDIEKMGALAPSDEPYLKTGIFQLARNRIFWLLALMLSATLTSIIISNYEARMVAIPILMVFIPLLMDTGGNAGSQTSTLIIRGMAVGELFPKDIVRILWKEFRIALLVGLGLGIVNMIWVYVIYGQDLMLSFAVTMTLYSTLIIAKILGSILPIVARCIKIDPAVMAAPMITTIVDALSLIIYFAIAKAILGL
ncbi:MAG: magnesium transporter [Treponema sp.]|jgi:magnesium transporter|nr:magnesium transporter [Treponema sp.]